MIITFKAHKMISDNSLCLNICPMQNAIATSQTTSDNSSLPNICNMIFITIKKATTMKQLIVFILMICAYSAQAQRTWNTPTHTSVAKQTVKWNFGGYTFIDQFTFNYSDYTYYKSLSKIQANSVYATEQRSHPYFLQLAKVLDYDAQNLGYTGNKLVEYLIAFVQEGIPYKDDPYNNGYDYPKYPIETILEGGDCEDKAALLVALLKTFGFDAVMVELPKHMAAAIAGNNYPSYYLHNGKKYSFIETTYPGWKIGIIPPEFKNALATILEVPKMQTYKREDAYAYNGQGKEESTHFINTLNTNRIPSCWDKELADKINALANKGKNSGNNNSTWINDKPNAIGNNVNVVSDDQTGRITITITNNGGKEQTNGSTNTTVIVQNKNVTITIR